MKRKILKSIMCLCLSLVFFSNLNNVTHAKNSSEYVEEINGGKDIRGVSRTGYILLAAGDAFSVEFTMNKWVSDDHNTFNVKISDFDMGSVKVKVTGSNGFAWESGFISSDTTYVISNAKPDVTYTVTIQASTGGSCYAKYSITSYIK